MFNGQHHIIQQQIMNIDFFDKAQVQPLYEKISRLCHDKLQRITERVFNQLIPENKVIKIDALQIDVGSISYPFLEEEFAEKYEAALEKELYDQIRLLQESSSNDGAPVSENIQENDLSLIRYFLQTGTIPWWAKTHDVKNVRDIITVLLRKEPERIKQLIWNIGQQAEVRYRLTYQFPEQTMKEIISLMEPVHAPFIFTYHNHIKFFHQKNQFIKTERTGLEKALWLFILTYLLVDQGSQFNRKMFIKSTLLQLAANFNSSYQDVLFLLSEALMTESEKLNEQGHLLAMIHELSTEQFYIHSASHPEEDPFSLDQHGFEHLKYYFLLGSFPLNSKLKTKEDVLIVFKSLKDRSPSQALELLLLLHKQEDVLHRLLIVFDKLIIQQMIELIEPAQEHFIMNYVTTISQHQKLTYKTRVGGEELKRLSWKVIFLYLFEKHPAIFEPPVFIETTLRTIALTYAIPFKEFLVLFIQGIGEAPPSQDDNSQLFYLLTGILKKYDLPETMPKLLAFVKEHDHSIGIAKQNLQARDVLLYWLSHGRLPWWKDHLTNSSLATIFEELSLSEYTYALQVIKFAFRNTIRKELFLSMITPTLILKFVSTLPEGNQAVELLTIVLDLSERTHHEASGKTQTLLLTTLLEIYQASDFEQFEPTPFLISALKKLSVSWNLEVEKIKALFFDIIHHHKEKNFPSVILQLLDDQFIKAERLFDRKKANTPVGHRNTEFLQLKEKHASMEDLVSESLDILNYFLVWNKLPENMASFDALQTDSILRDLIHLLAYENRNALRALFLKTGHSTDARMRIHDIFIYAKAPESENTKSLLVEFFKEDVIHYLLEKNIIRHQTSDLADLMDMILKLPMTKSNSAQLQHIFKSQAVLHLMAHQFRNEKFQMLIRLFVSEKDLSFIKGIRYVLNLLGSDNMEREMLDVMLREFSLMYYTNPLSSTDHKNFIAAFMIFMQSKSQLSSLKLHHLLVTTKGKLSGFTNSDELFVILNTMTLESKKYMDKEKAEARLNEEIKQSAELLLNKIQPPKKESLHSEEVNPEKVESHHLAKENKNTLEDKVYIRNAGLVILHPLLSTYFQRVNLMEHGKFINEQSQWRAVHLLQYLVWETQDHAEEDLVLNKILCGLHTNTPLPSGIEMTETEQAISLELIKVVLSQWDKLKNTSVEGFKTSFLQREGMISENEEHFILRVEQRGYDMLLQSLPWAFGMIKTSWMHKPILVEWT